MSEYVKGSVEWRGKITLRVEIANRITTISAWDF